MTTREKFQTINITGQIAAAMFLAIATLSAIITAACAPIPPTQPPPTPPLTTQELRARFVTSDGATPAPTFLSLDFDEGQPSLPCTFDGVTGITMCPLLRSTPIPFGAHLRAQFDAFEPASIDVILKRTPDFATWQLAPAPNPAPDNGNPQAVVLTPLPPLDPPLLEKATLIRTAQENFGGIKLPGCGLHRDSLFDPFLLWAWLNNRPCFEQMLQEHGRRNDNTVTVDPKAGYHGFNDADVWHDPATFTAFVRDVRRHTNWLGEHFRVRVFMAGDDHIPDMRAPGAWAHWQRDVAALAQQAGPYVEFVVPCWECRHQNDYVSAKTYYDMLAFLVVQFPRAVHSVHLISGSSAPSSWRCDPQIPGSCADPGDGPPANDADDPARGNEPYAWVYMLDRGLVDEFLYQFETGGAFMYASTYDQNADAPSTQWARGAMGRWWDIAVRLGDDPQSRLTACAAGAAFCGRRGWRQVPIKAWEFIYDRYWDRDPGTVTEEYLNDWCRKALALGGWGCGSASYRRQP